MAYEGYDYSGIEEQLKQRAQQKGLAYDPSDLEGIKRNASYTGPGTTAIDPQTGLQNAFANYDQRASNTPNQSMQYASPAQQWNAQPSSPSSNPLYALLMQRAQQGTSVDRNDPLVRQQVDPATAQMQRASRGYINDIAEKAGPLANIQGEQRLQAERTGQAASSLESEVIARLQAQKQAEQQNALGLWGDLYQGDQGRALTRELGYLSDARAGAGQDIQRQGLSNSMDQFLRELALRESDQNQGWDYRWATLGV